MRILVLICLIFALTTPISACGKKGDPEPPAVKNSEYPRVYPQ
tara:strand:+ start:252 stop:380 length:129 start_codon:yes stop_codon:yes gene_type:complete